MTAGFLIGKISKRDIDDVDILFLFNQAGVGGAEKVQKEVLKCAEEFKNLTIISSGKSEKRYLSDYSRFSSIWDLSDFSSGILGRWIVAGYLAALIRKSRPPLVFGSRSGLFYDLLIALNRKLPDMTFVDLFHACDNNIEYYSMEVVPKIDRRIVIDGMTYSRLRSLYSSKESTRNIDHLLLVENGVKIPPPIPRETDSAPVSLYVGRDAPVKRVHLIRRIAERVRECPFLLVGVEKHRKDPPNLRALGIVENPESVYERSDLLLITSTREGFPMAVMEAMAHGVIPVCTDVGGISTHLRNGENGFLIDSEQSEDAIVTDFVRYIELLKNDETLRSRISRQAYIYATNNFDIEKFRKTYKKLFHEWIGGK